MGSYPKTIGIMVSESQIHPPFAQHNFFAYLCTLGTKWGLKVYIFSPQHVNSQSLMVQGYIYRSSKWIKAEVPWPDIIYDRAFFENQNQFQRHHSAIHAFQQIKKTPLLGRPLKGKWSVHKVLIQHPMVSMHLPKTQPFLHASQLFRWFKEHDSVVLKPEAGSQGKGVLIITQTGATDYALLGRTLQNQAISQQFPTRIALFEWLTAFVGHRNYLLQQYLTLTTEEGFAYDIRVLIQKGRKGIWEQTGMAARVGTSKSITSNLHGGGRGTDVLPLLEKQFDPDRVNAMITIINQLSASIPPLLEQHFGRLAELGLDIGIDHIGNVWVIEVNSKPGRAVSRWFAHPAAMEHALSNPLRYARFLLT
jgi:hypothetical protein